MEEASASVIYLLLKPGPFWGCPSLLLYWTSNPSPLGATAVPSIFPQPISRGQENMAHLSSHHAEASAFPQHLYSSAKRWKGNPFYQRKPSSFPICIPLQESELLSSHSKTFCFHSEPGFICLKLQFVPSFLLWKRAYWKSQKMLYGLKKNQIIVEVWRNLWDFKSFLWIKLHPSLFEGTIKENYM